MGEKISEKDSGNWLIGVERDVEEVYIYKEIEEKIMILLLLLLFYWFNMIVNVITCGNRVVNEWV